jgi:hypothetical protein
VEPCCPPPRCATPGERLIFLLRDLGNLLVLPAKPALLAPGAAWRIKNYGDRLAVTLSDPVALPLLDFESEITCGLV